MGTTPRGALPYPEPSMPISAGADNIKALAVKIDGTLSQVAGGVASVANTNVAYSQVAVALPAGRFDAPPAVAISVQTNVYLGGTSAVTATGFQVWIRTISGTPATNTVPVAWVATRRG